MQTVDVRVVTEDYPAAIDAASRLHRSGDPSLAPETHVWLAVGTDPAADVQAWLDSRQRWGWELFRKGGVGSCVVHATG
jgi:hypothetical protein